MRVRHLPAAAAVALCLAALALCLAPPAPALAAGPAADPATDSLAADSLAAGSTLSLPALERWVLARNPDLEAMRQTLVAARARVGMEGALMDPELEFGFAPASLDEPGLRAGYRVGIRQMVPWSKLGPRRAVARHEASADSAGVARLRNDLLRAARQAYADHVRGSASLEVVGELQELVERFRKTALSRYAAGLAGEADPLMAEVEQSRLAHEAFMSEQMRDVAKARINALLRRAWDARIPPAPVVFDAARPIPPLAALMDRAARVHPEIAAAEARVLASRARQRLAGRERWPDLGLMASYDRFMMEDPYRFMVGVSVNLPLYFGRISATEREARAGAAQARALAAAERDRIAADVQEAYWSVVNAEREAELVRDRELLAVQRALGAARAGYEAGRNDFLTLLNAERDLARTRLEEIRILADYHLALADLERAVGALLPPAATAPRPGEEGWR